MIDQTTDPDYYYHVAMSRHILENGLPHSIPQVKGTGWDILFSDKEFLFHQVTTFFYWIFGETGLRIAPLVLSTLTFLIMAFQAFQKLPRRLFFIPLLILLSEPYFIRRITMVRPQVLAILVFTLLLYGLLNRKKYIVGISAALYTLSYHALQIPIMIFFAGLFTFSKNDPERRKCLGALALGLFVGVLINPYFPGNLMIIPQIIDIVLDTHKGTLSYGGELYPWVSNSMLNYSLVTFLICGFVLYTVGIKSRNEDSDHKQADQKMLLVLAAFFYAVSSMTPRGREYLIPCLFFLTVFAIENRKYFQIPWPFKKGSPPLLLVLLATVIIQWGLVRSDYSFLFHKPTPNAVITALEKTSPTETSHVLNCNWSDSPQIMYSRPKMTFLDIMDPTFLVREVPGLHLARTDLLNGRFADLYFSAKYIFKAKYILCSENNLNDRLDHDPRFKRIFPDTPVKSLKDVYALFELKDVSSEKYFVKEFLYQSVDALKKNPQSWLTISPSMQISENKNQKQQMDYLDFNQSLEKKILVAQQKETDESGKPIEVGSISCVYIKPSPQDIKNNLGKEVLGVGGGPNIRAWLNEKPLFESYGEPANAVMIQTLIPLPRPLAAQDDIKLMVCPGTVAKFYGTAISFFSYKDIDDLCKEKNSNDLLTRRESLIWPFKGDSVKTCLANMAARR